MAPYFFSLLHVCLRTWSKLSQRIVNMCSNISSCHRCVFQSKNEQICTRRRCRLAPWLIGLKLLALVLMFDKQKNCIKLCSYSCDHDIDFRRNISLYCFCSAFTERSSHPMRNCFWSSLIVLGSWIIPAEVISFQWMLWAIYISLYSQGGPFPHITEHCYVFGVGSELHVRSLSS